MHLFMPPRTVTFFPRQGWSGADSDGAWTIKEAAAKLSLGPFRSLGVDIVQLGEMESAINIAEHLLCKAC